MPCKIQSLYICVRDMERAIRFYEALFDRKVSLKDEIYSVFDLDGFRFGLFAYEKKRKHTSMEIAVFQVLNLKV